MVLLDEPTAGLDPVRLERELHFEDLLSATNRNGLRIRISAGYAQAEEDNLIKEVLAKAESKDSLYYEFEVGV